jgi:hypothetical protein
MDSLSSVSFSGAPLYDRLLALLTNIRNGWKSLPLPGPSTLVYLANLCNYEGKRVLNMSPGVKAMRLTVLAFIIWKSKLACLSSASIFCTA